MTVALLLQERVKGAEERRRPEFEERRGRDIERTQCCGFCVESFCVEVGPLMFKRDDGFSTTSDVRAVYERAAFC